MINKIIIHITPLETSILTILQLLHSRKKGILTNYYRRIVVLVGI